MPTADRDPDLFAKIVGFRDDPVGFVRFAFRGEYTSFPRQWQVIAKALAAKTTEPPAA